MDVSSAPSGGIDEDVQRSLEMTMPAVRTDLRNLPYKWIASGFLELAEEALLVDVGSTPSDCMEEIGPQRCGIGEAMSKDISWRMEDIVDRSVDFGLKEAMRMPTSVFDEDRLLQWPNEKCTDGMNCAYTRESQMHSHGPVWREAELVFVAAESEVFTPVFYGGVRSGNGSPCRGGGSYNASFCSADGWK